MAGEPVILREDVNAMLFTLYDIKELLVRLVELTEATMAKKKRLSNKEWWSKHREQFERTDKLLKERIAYHEAKLAEERRAAD